MKAAANRNTAARYWSLFVLDTVGTSSHLAITELELRGTPNGPDLTTPQTPITSTMGPWGPAYKLHYAIDNELAGTYIAESSAAKNVRIVLDLGAPVSVGALAIYKWDGNVPAAQMPKNFRLEASNDGVNFETRGTFLETGWSPNNTWFVFTT